MDLKVMSSRMGLADFREDVECEIHVEGGVGGKTWKNVSASSEARNILGTGNSLME